MFLREHKQSQSASSQGVVIHGPRVGQNVPALVHHHPAKEAQYSHPGAHQPQYNTTMFTLNLS